MGELQNLETVSFDNFINDGSNFEVLRNVTNVIVDNIYSDDRIEYLIGSMKDFERIKYLEFTGGNTFNQAIVDSISSLVNLKELIIEPDNYNFEPSCDHPLNFSGVLSKRPFQFTTTDEFRNKCIAKDEIENPEQGSSTITKTSTISKIIKPTSDDSNSESSDDDDDDSNDENIVEVDDNTIVEFEIENDSDDDNDVVEVENDSDDDDVVEVENDSDDDNDVVEVENNSDDDNDEDVVEVDDDN